MKDYEGEHSSDTVKELDQLLTSLPLDLMLNVPSKSAPPTALPTSILSCLGPSSTSFTLFLVSVNAERLCKYLKLLLLIIIVLLSVNIHVLIIKMIHLSVMSSTYTYTINYYGQKCIVYMYMYESPLPWVVVVTVALCCRASLSCRSCSSLALTSSRALRSSSFCFCLSLIQSWLRRFSCSSWKWATLWPCCRRCNSSRFLL